MIFILVLLALFSVPFSLMGILTLFIEYKDLAKKEAQEREWEKHNYVDRSLDYDKQARYNEDE